MRHFYAALCVVRAASLVGLAVAVALLPSCTAAIRENCPIIMEGIAPRPMPSEFTEIDRLLIQRAKSMASGVRGLNRSLTVTYQREFLEDVLPRMCALLEEARAKAASGKTEEAGTLYQGLLVASQVMMLEVAMEQMAAFADSRGQVSTQIASQLRLFDREMAPIMAAALSRDRGRLAATMPVAVARYNEWLHHLDTWSARLQLGERRVQEVKMVWDTLMVAIAAYEMAGSAAAAVAGGGPPSVGGVGAGGAVATQLDSVAVARALEAIRKLIASGALEPGVVAGVSAMAGQKPLPPHMSKVRRVNGRLPVNSEWAGRTYPLDRLLEELRAKYPKSVQFTEEGFPNFRPYAVKEVKVQGLKGNTGSDYKLANRAAGYDEVPDGYTWHHHQDCTTMQLVPTDLHEAVRHTGGAAILNPPIVAE